MPRADLKAARLHGAGKALEKRPVIVDDNERAVLRKLVSMEGEVFGHGEVLLTPLFMPRYGLTQRLLAEKPTKERDSPPWTSRKAQALTNSAPGSGSQSRFPERRWARVSKPQKPPVATGFAPRLPGPAAHGSRAKALHRNAR